MDIKKIQTWLNIQYPVKLKVILVLFHCADKLSELNSLNPDLNKISELNESLLGFLYELQIYHSYEAVEELKKEVA